MNHQTVAFGDLGHGILGISTEEHVCPGIVLLQGARSVHVRDLWASDANPAAIRCSPQAAHGEKKKIKNTVLNVRTLNSE